MSVEEQIRRGLSEIEKKIEEARRTGFAQASFDVRVDEFDLHFFLVFCSEGGTVGAQGGIEIRSPYGRLAVEMKGSDVYVFLCSMGRDARTLYLALITWLYVEDIVKAVLSRVPNAYGRVWWDLNLTPSYLEERPEWARDLPTLTIEGWVPETRAVRLVWGA